MKKMILITVMLICFTGCSATQFDDMAIVDSVIITKTDEYKLIFKISYKTDEDDSYYIEGTGETIEETVDNTSDKYNKTLYFGHTEIILIDEKIIEDEISNIISYIDENLNTRFFIDVAAVSLPEDMNSYFENSDITSREILNSIDIFVEENSEISTNYFYLLRSYYNSEEITIPVVFFTDDSMMNVITENGLCIKFE